MSEPQSAPAEVTGDAAAAAETTPPPATEQPASVGGDVAALQLQLEDARSKADEHWDQLLRLRAELENGRRRAQREVEQAHKYALEKFAADLIPVRDSLELGLNAAQGSGADGVDKLREGTELTLKMLTDVFEKFGITEVDPQGQPFDPERHQAMTMQESSELPPNSVAAVIQKGYLLNDRLLRPAMVMVTKAPTSGSSSIDTQA